MKDRTFSASFFPGRSSTPEETSTPQGFRMRIASPTFDGVRPPATTSLSPPCRIASAMGTAFSNRRVGPSRLGVAGCPSPERKYRTLHQEPEAALELPAKDVQSRPPAI